MLRKRKKAADGRKPLQNSPTPSVLRNADSDSLDAFRAELGGVLLGSHSPHGSSSLSVDTGADVNSRQAVELHEHLHGELIDNSAFGWLQRFLAEVQRHPYADLRRNSKRVLDATMASSFFVQEGLATHRQASWIAFDAGGAAADRFGCGLPPDYQDGFDMAVRILGDPAEAPYQGFSPPAFHIIVVAVGVAILNSPVLAAYREPDSLFDEALPFINQQGPDQRFRSILDHDAEVREIITFEMARAHTERETLTDISRLHERFDAVTARIAEVCPSLEFVSSAERAAQARQLKESWIPWLNERSGSKLYRDGGAFADVGDERVLDMRYERLNAGRATARARSRTLPRSARSPIRRHRVCRGSVRSW